MKITHCKHSDCDGQLFERTRDPYLPPQYDGHVCGGCGELWAYDTEHDCWEANP